MQDVAHIEDVTVTGSSTIAVTWRDGSMSAVDLAGWISRGTERIAPLKDPAVFARAAVGLYGGNVTWGDAEGGRAIDSEHLRMLAEHQAPFGAVEAAGWQAEMAVSNAEAADLLAVAPSTWSSYKAGATIPATVARLCRAMRGDSVILSAHLRPRVMGRPRTRAEAIRDDFVESVGKAAEGSPFRDDLMKLAAEEGPPPDRPL